MQITSLCEFNELRNGKEGGVGLLMRREDRHGARQFLTCISLSQFLFFKIMFLFYLHLDFVDIFLHLYVYIFVFEINS